MSGTCEGCNGDGGCPVHDPPTCKRCKSEYTMDWPHTEPTAYCDACAHAVAGELTADLATAIAERDALAETRAALTANLNALTIALGESRSELAEARRQLGEAVEVQEDLAGKLFDSVRERDALKARKHLSAWEHQSGRHWSSRKFNGGGDCLQVWLERGRWRWVAIDDSGDAFTEDDAKSAADRSVLNRSDGWWLEGGAHGAGEKP